MVGTPSCVVGLAGSAIAPPSPASSTNPVPSQRIDAVAVDGMLLPRPDRMAIPGDSVAVHAIAAAGAGNLPRLTSHGC